MKLTEGKPLLVAFEEGGGACSFLLLLIPSTKWGSVWSLTHQKASLDLDGCGE